MDDSVKQIVREAIVKIIRETASQRNIEKIQRVHGSKIHFVPTRYRVLGGLIQSLNIKFGNFIEKLIDIIVQRDPSLEALPYSGKKIRFSMTSETDSRIDRYISNRQLPNSPDNCDELFGQLLEEIVAIESQGSGEIQTITKDVDAIFKVASGQIVYLEIKYNDDHDTGKFVDINRKFIKTYAGLVNLLNITSSHQLKPILYYFNPIKRWGSIYIPSSNVYRGEQLFNEYFTLSFSELDNYLRNLEEDQEIMKKFDDLYKMIRYES